MVQASGLNEHETEKTQEIGDREVWCATVHENTAVSIFNHSD